MALLIRLVAVKDFDGLEEQFGLVPAPRCMGLQPGQQVGLAIALRAHVAVD